MFFYSHAQPWSACRHQRLVWMRCSTRSSASMQAQQGGTCFSRVYLDGRVLLLLDCLHALHTIVHGQQQCLQLPLQPLNIPAIAILHCNQGSDMEIS